MIDAFVRVSLVGIEILKIDIRIVVASVDTYLRFAEACNRLDLESGPRKPAGLTELTGKLTESGARGKTKGALSGAAETISDAFRQAREEAGSVRAVLTHRTRPKPVRAGGDSQRHPVDGERDHAGPADQQSVPRGVEVTLPHRHDARCGQRAVSEP